MRILLVEDNPGDIRLLQEYLKEAGADRYQITHVDRLARGLERLTEANVDAVLLDLSLPDSHGMDTLIRVREAAKVVPIVVLTGIEDEALGMRLIQAGAQDYLIKGQVTGQLLTRSLRYAVERKRAEVALRDSEERFRHLFEGAQDVIITLSNKGVITSLNPAFERITQWACDEWIGQPLAPLFHSDDLPLAIDLFRDIAEHGEALTRVLRIRSYDRGYVVGEFVGVPHVQNGQTSGLLVIGRDITERKRAEDTLERLRHLYGLLLTSAPDGIYGVDLQGNALFVNPAAARMLGSSSEELFGRHMHDVVHHTKPDGTVYHPDDCPIYRILRGGGMRRVAADVFWRTDGTSFPVEYTSTPIVERGGVVGAVVMFRDITERKLAEGELQRTLGQVLTLSRRLEVVREEERTRIARELHDELGVRMACLKMDLARMQSMRGDASPAKLQEKILSMTEQVDTTIAAVQSLVAELRPGVLDDLGLVAAIEWQCRDFERRSGIRCLVDVNQEDIPLDSVRATAAFRICQEALTNVLRHAAAKEVRVRLELIDRQLLLDIHDDGQGIPPGKVCDARSFGLLGMRERADAVGGALRIVGLPGLGTTVTLRLPCD